MSQNPSIELRWQPITPCMESSPGCACCHIMPVARRLATKSQVKCAGTNAKANETITWAGDVHLDEKALELPESWEQPRRILVNSRSDLFHENVTLYVSRPRVSRNSERSKASHARFQGEHH